MTRLLFGGFLIVHGFIHSAVYLLPPPPDKPQPFDPGHSWILAASHVADDSAHRAARALAIATTALFTISGLVVFVGSSAWIPMTVAAAGLGLMLKVLYFHPWLILGAAIDVALIWTAYAEWPSSLA
jgi:hypothetical protein